MPMPIARPILYAKVTTLPVASFNGAATLTGASIIDNDALSPLVMPSAATNRNAGVTPSMTGCERGVQHSNMRASIAVRMVASKISCLFDHAYGIRAVT